MKITSIDVEFVVEIIASDLKLLLLAPLQEIEQPVGDLEICWVILTAPTIAKKIIVAVR